MVLECTKKVRREVLFISSGMGDSSDGIASYEILEKARGISIIHLFFKLQLFFKLHFIIQLDFNLTARTLFFFFFPFF